MSANTRVYPRQSQASPGWLLGPRADVLCIVNALWPIVALIGGLFYEQLNLFWVYLLLSASHRWLTLPLMAVDWAQIRPRRRSLTAVGMATIIAFAGLLVWGVSLATIGILVLVIDSWHRSAQHFGMVRLYERAEGYDSASDGRWRGQNPRLLQAMVLYTFVRAVGFGAATRLPSYVGMLYGPWIWWLDCGALLLAGWIVASALGHLKRPPENGPVTPSLRPFYLRPAARQRDAGVDRLGYGLVCRRPLFPCRRIPCHRHLAHQTAPGELDGLAARRRPGLAPTPGRLHHLYRNHRRAHAAGMDSALVRPEPADLPAALPVRRDHLATIRTRWPSGAGGS